MRVGVVGAGIAGLAAARRLVRAGCEVTVFEADATVGGRCSTAVIDGFTFDPGATSIVPRGKELERVILDELDTTDLVQIESPVFTHDGRRTFLGTGMPPSARYCYRQGINHLAVLLSEGLAIETGRRVEAIERSNDDGYMLLGARFDAVVLAVTTPEAQRLLSTVDEQRTANNTRYRACLSVLLGYDKSFSAPFHAIVAEESVHPMHWLSVENLKVPGRAPKDSTALVVQLGPKYSKWNFEAPEKDVYEDTLVDVERVLGPGFEHPIVKRVVKWKESQPDSVSGFDSINPPGARLVVAGDGIEGGRLEHAYDSGIKAANLLVGK